MDLGMVLHPILPKPYSDFDVYSFAFWPLMRFSHLHTFFPRFHIVSFSLFFVVVVAIDCGKWWVGFVLFCFILLSIHWSIYLYIVWIHLCVHICLCTCSCMYTEVRHLPWASTLFSTFLLRQGLSLTLEFTDAAGRPASSEDLLFCTLHPESQAASCFLWDRHFTTEPSPQPSSLDFNLHFLLHK